VRFRAIILSSRSYSQPVFAIACDGGVLYSHPLARKPGVPYIASVSPRNPQHPAISRLFSPLTSLLATIVIKRWDRSHPLCPGTVRTYPGSPTISSSESSLLEGQTPGRRPSCSESVTPQRVQRSTGVINGDVARGYVPVPSGTFNLII
jgi:hypothetical protein